MVRVRSASEIFATLDADGALDGVLFMPEMIKFCGRTLPVTQRADATCAGDGLVRHMADTVHLRNIRCDGAFHDGCQAGCLMYWKEAWLQRAEDADASGKPRRLDDPEQAFVNDTLMPATRRPRVSGEGDDLWRCQATDVKLASRPMRLRETAQYKRALDNWTLMKLIVGLFTQVINEWQERSRQRLPK